MVKPIYKHDCRSCVFLGRYVDCYGEKFDLYFCDTAVKTVIARYSDDGPDYCSGWGSCLPQLQEAQRRAELYLKIIEL